MNQTKQCCDSMWVCASALEVVGASQSQDVGWNVCLHPLTVTVYFVRAEKKLKCYLVTCPTVLT